MNSVHKITAKTAVSDFLRNYGALQNLTARNLKHWKLTKSTITTYNSHDNYINYYNYYYW